MRIADAAMRVRFREEAQAAEAAPHEGSDPSGREVQRGGSDPPVHTAESVPRERSDLSGHGGSREGSDPSGSTGAQRGGSDPPVRPRTAAVEWTSENSKWTRRPRKPDGSTKGLTPRAEDGSLPQQNDQDATGQGYSRNPHFRRKESGKHSAAKEMKKMSRPRISSSLITTTEMLCRRKPKCQVRLRPLAAHCQARPLVQTGIGNLHQMLQLIHSKAAKAANGTQTRRG